MTGVEVDPGASGQHTEARLKRWVNSVSTVTLPLLAGFSITSAVVVSSNIKDFLWPGAAIVVLTFAALVLIISVQCAYHAHVYLGGQDPEQEKGVYWAQWTRRFYDAGLFAVLFGLALAVAPRDTTDVQAGFQWAASVLAWLLCVGEVVWVWRDDWLRSAWRFHKLR
jgi:hypothetical protein